MTVNILRPTIISAALVLGLLALGSSLLRSTGLNAYAWHITWPLVGLIFLLHNRKAPRTLASFAVDLARNPGGLKRFRYAKAGLAIGLLFGMPSMFVDVLCSDNDLCEFVVLVPAYLAVPLYPVLSVYYLHAVPLWHGVLGFVIGYSWGRRGDRAG